MHSDLAINRRVSLCGPACTRLLLLMLSTCVLCLLSAGCMIFRASPPTPGELTDDEEKLVKALASYAKCLVSIEEDGSSSTNAIIELEKAIALDPERSRLNLKLARIYRHRDLVEKSIATLEQAARDNPDSAEIKAGLAFFYRRTGNIDRAIKHYEKALKINPEDTDNRVLLADLYFEQEMDRKALKVIREGMSAENRAPLLKACNGWGRRFIARNQADRAIPIFELIADRYTEKSAEFYYIIGELYEFMEKPEPAVESYIESTKKTPAYEMAFLKLADIYTRREEYQKARTVLEKALELFPGDTKIKFFTGVLYEAENNFTNAVRVYAEIENASKTNSAQQLLPLFYLHYGAVHEKSGDMQTAEKLFEEGLEKYPDTHEIMNYMAYMWAEKGIKLDKAEDLVNKALELDPGNPAYLDTLGWIFYMKKDYNKALTQIKSAGSKLENDPVIMDHLGDIYHKMNETEKAVEHWKRSYVIDPTNDKVIEKLKKQGIKTDKLKKENPRSDRPLSEGDTTRG